MRLKKRPLLLMMQLMAALLSCQISTVFGKTVLSITGDISKISFVPKQNYYRVTGEIFVPVAAEVHIPAGTVLLFDAKATFRIDGNCFAEGTAQEPVVLTSVNDTFLAVANAKPTIFDWNGIRINQSASKVVFENLIIKYAEHPLESNCSSLQLLRCMRMKTSDDFFLLNGTPRKVDVAVPFSDPLPLPPAPPLDYVNRDQDITPSPAPQPPVISPTKDTPRWKKKTVRWTLLGTGSAAILVASGFTIGYFAYDKDYRQQKEIAESFDITIGKNYDVIRNADAKARNAGINRDRCKPPAVICGILGTVLLAGFGLTFTF